MGSGSTRHAAGADRCARGLTGKFPVVRGPVCRLDATTRVQFLYRSAVIVNYRDIGSRLTPLFVGCLILAGITVGFGIMRDATGGPRSLHVADLRVGDCIRDMRNVHGMNLDVVPCASPHASELFATFDLPAGLANTISDAKVGCDQRFEAYSGLKKPANDSYIVFAAPLDGKGYSVDLGVLCFAYQVSDTTTGSVRR